MARLRFIPKGGALVEVTTRTQHGRLLLRPNPELNEIVQGILARAQRLYLPKGTGLCGFCFLSNHYHLLLRVDNAGQLAAFMRYVNSNLAREIARLVDWRDHVWARRYQAIVVSDEPTAQEERLRYLLSQGVKEGLVAHPKDWPGPTSIRALLYGETVVGAWFDRSKEYFARRKKEAFERDRYATRETLTLLPIPAWDSLARDERALRTGVMIDEIVTQARELRGDRRPLGHEAVLRQRPFERPWRSKRTPAPLFHTTGQEARNALLATYRAFVGAFRRAARHQRETGPVPLFPPGSFPPALPFVEGGND